MFYARDNTPEPSQRQQYMQVIAEKTQHGLFERIVWKPQSKAEIVVRGLGHRVVVNSDELLCARWVVQLPAVLSAVSSVPANKYCQVTRASISSFLVIT